MTTTKQLIAKCQNGHVVRGTYDQRAGFSANVERGCVLRCECGSAGFLKWMDVRIVEGMKCAAKCMNATGPACSCSCGGRNHGGRRAFRVELVPAAAEQAELF
jgi:hypothetical protein